MQRDRAKKAKAAAKRQRRTERDGEALEGAGTATHDDAISSDGGGTGELSAPELLRQIEALQRRYEAELIDYEEYDEAKRDLLARLPID